MPLPLPGGEETPSRPFTLEEFGSLNTKAKRPAIDPKEFSWIENWMPIGPGNMRTLYAEGADIHDDPLEAIIFYYAYNLGSEQFMAIFHDDGTAHQVSLDTGTIVDIATTPGTFWVPGQGLPACAQWQSKYLLIATPVEDDGYFIWDGTALFQAGTLQPEAIIFGSGRKYTSAPTVTVTGGTGTGATFLAEVQNESVTKITTVNPGSGYLVNEVVTLQITGGGSDDQALLTATVDMSVGGVVLAQVTNGGSGYSAPLVSFSGGGGSGAKAFVSGAANGSITDITVTDPGTGYTSNPTVTITDSGGGTGSGATAISQMRRGVITAITVVDGGSGYVGVPDIVISPPDGLEFPSVQAEAYATITAGAVSAVTLTSNGAGYREATVSVSGGNDSAEAEISIMPHGIAGGSIETYQGRVFIAEETKYSFTAPDSVSNFSTVAGGGSKPVTESFLRQKITALRQSSGFLYRFGDSSINVISNVQTSATGTTTMNDTNVDPQIGSAWRDSVAAFGRALVFANPTGVYALYGGAAEKVSSQLDGLFANASFNTGVDGVTPSAAVCTVFGIRCYCLLMTSIDPLTGVLRDMMLMWDGQRWFAATQLKMPTFLNSQQFNSELTAWGTDGAALYPLFQESSNELEKVFQTKLVAAPSYVITDQVLRVYYIVQAEESVNEPVSVRLDNERGSVPAIEKDVATALEWTGLDGLPLDWSGLAAAPLYFTVRGLRIIMYDDSQFGQLIGATVRTFATDLTMISLTLLMREFSPNG